MKIRKKPPDGEAFSFGNFYAGLFFNFFACKGLAVEFTRERTHEGNNLVSVGGRHFHTGEVDAHNAHCFVKAFHCTVMQVRSCQFNVAQIRHFEFVQVMRILGKAFKTVVRTERIAAFGKIILFEVHIFKGLTANGLAYMAA